MGGPYVGNAATFLIQTIFWIYILILMLRFLFQLVRADFYNQFSQFIVRATNPPLVRLRRVIPGFAGLDLSALVLVLALKLVELWLIYRIGGYDPSVSGLVVMSVAEVFSLTVKIFQVSILIQVVLSWLSPSAYNPITNLLYSLNEPLLRPARRVIPPISGLDLSPLVVLMVLQLGSMLIIAPIADIARGLL